MEAFLFNHSKGKTELQTTVHQPQGAV